MSRPPINCSSSELTEYLRLLREGFLPCQHSEPCTCSPGAGEASSPTNSSGTIRFARSRSMDIASGFFWHGKKRVTYPGFRFSLISANSTATPGGDWSTSLREDSPAPTSRPLDCEPESMESSLDSGWKWRGSWARYDPDSFLWKTRQLSFLGDSEPFSGVFPNWGTLRDGEFWGQDIPARFIDVTESGLWPTPTAGDGKSSGSRNTATSRAKFGLSLTDAIRCDQGRGRKIAPACSADIGLTMHTSGNTGAPIAREIQTGFLPTPSANDWKIVSAGGQRRRQLSDPEQNVIAAGEALNPDWVERLMGWPVGWSGLDPVEDPTIPEDWSGDWEAGIPRARRGEKNRTLRLKVLGNGQVPQCAALAWRVLTEHLREPGSGS